MATPLQVEDHRIAHPRGRLFARSWAAAGAAARRAPIVLLHDSLGCVELWRDFPAALCEATGRRVVAFGHSVGGGMAVNCAARWADDCEALVTVSAQAFVEDRTVQGLRVAREQFKEPAQMQRLARYHGDKAAWVLEAWLGTWLSAEFAGWSLEGVLPRVRCPALAIHGADDEYGSPAHPALIAARAGAPVRIELLAQTGHVPHRERPEAVLEAVAALLASAG